MSSVSKRSGDDVLQENHGIKPLDNGLSMMTCGSRILVTAANRPIVQFLTMCLGCSDLFQPVPVVPHTSNGDFVLREKLITV